MSDALNTSISIVPGPSIPIRQCSRVSSSASKSPSTIKQDLAFEIVTLVRSAAPLLAIVIESQTPALWPPEPTD